jgi:peptide/nickel transport system substrate-binding protein
MGRKLQKIQPVWFVFFIFFLLLSCSKGDMGSALVVGVETNPTNLDPRLAVDIASLQVTDIVYNRLVKKDRHSNIVPDLAEKWEMPDDTTYVFHLRKGVKFHDGTPLTADDVKYTFDSIRDPSLKSPKRSSTSPIKEIRVIDKHTISFVLKRPFAPFLSNMIQGIVPMHIAKDKKNNLSRNPVGTGPYKLSKWEFDQKLELAANEDYFEGRPRLDRVVYKIIPDQTVRLLELEKGSVHLIQNGISPDVISRLEQNPKLKLIKETGVNYSYIGFNLEDSILKNKKVRHAIAHAINREDIIKNIQKGLAIPATGLLSPSHWAYEPKVRKFPYDPKKAKRLLDEAGYPDPDGDGPKPRFAIRYKTSQNQVRKRIAEVIQEQLIQVGIKVEMRSYEWGTFFSDIRSGNFQMYTLTWVGVTDPDIYYYIFYSGSVPPKGANRGRYSNKALDRLIEQGRYTLDLEKRKRIYSEIQKIIAEDSPYISLWYLKNVAVMRKELKGFELYPGEQFYSLKDVFFDNQEGR